MGTSVTKRAAFREMEPHCQEFVASEVIAFVQAMSDSERFEVRNRRVVEEFEDKIRDERVEGSSWLVLSHVGLEDKIFLGRGWGSVGGALSRPGVAVGWQT